MPHPDAEHSLRIQLATALRERDEALERERCSVAVLQRSLAAANARADAAEALLAEANATLSYAVKRRIEETEALAAARRECEELLESARENDELLTATRQQDEAVRGVLRDLIDTAEMLRQGMIPMLYDEDLTHDRMVQHLSKLPNLLNAIAQTEQRARAALAAPADGEEGTR